jgi:hypothetical protein
MFQDLDIVRFKERKEVRKKQREMEERKRKKQIMKKEI